MRQSHIHRADFRTLLAISSVIGATACGAACLSGCGGSQKVENKSTTVGQELQDLETARNKGLLTEDEYQKQRQEVLKRK